MVKKLEVAAAFVKGYGVRRCPHCGARLELDTKDPWNNGVRCRRCEANFNWREWEALSEKWKWDEERLVSFFGDETDVTVPERCTCIGSYAFSNSNAVSLRMGENVECIEPFAFSNSCLEKVVLPEGLERIEEGIFQGCDALKSVLIPETVVYIGKNAFAGCTALKSILIPDSVRMIDEGAFSGSGLEKVTLVGTSVIADNAFYACADLCTVSVQATRIGNRAFADCRGLRSVRLENGVVSVGEQAFFNCGALERLWVSSGVYEFGNQAFANVHRLVAHIPEKLREHVTNFEPGNPTYGADRKVLFEKTAELKFREGGNGDEG